MSVARLHESFHEERIRTTADALAALPRIVTEAMRIAEESGRAGPEKRQMVMDWVAEFFAKRAQDSADALAMGADIIGSLVPAMIDQLIGVENGKVIIAKDKACCLSMCACLGALMRRAPQIRQAVNIR